MTIRKNKGKWEFGYKDTYSLDDSLSPIIAAGVRKFKDVLEERNNRNACIGIPHSVCNGGEVDDDSVKKWFDILDKIVYAFENKEPDSEGFDFELDRTFEKIEGTKLNRMNINCSDDDAWDRYIEALKEHRAKVQEGVDLFAKHFKDLWW